MPLLIVAYPTFPEPDMCWTEAIRAAHDKLHAVIRAHITLVFPDQSISAEHLIDHAQKIVQGVLQFQVMFRCANVVRDTLSDQTGVFLVPDEGNAALVKLHDRLYTGTLASRRRLDVPYIPHITVGTSPDPLACQALADALNSQEFRLAGAVTAIDVVRYESGRVDTIRQLPLR